MIRRVLVATDFSSNADYTLGCIGQIPGMEEILLVHVISGAPAGTGLFQNHQPSPREQAQKPLKKNGSILNR